VGTKLVALSACDTRVGEVKNGDGVHGLRRALVLAGAETQVMSLWAVSDRATRELMVSYYRKLLEGEGCGEALRQVQLEMRKRRHWRHPFYWASFIRSGEWANLDGQRWSLKFIQYAHGNFSIGAHLLRIIIIAQAPISALIHWPGGAPKPLNFYDFCIICLAELSAGIIICDIPRLGRMPWDLLKSPSFITIIFNWSKQFPSSLAFSPGDCELWHIVFNTHDSN
jgi:hypothetical protein